MTIAQTRSWMMAGLVAFGFCCLLCDGLAEAQQLSPAVREHVKNATGQIPSYEVFIGGSQVHPVRYGTRLKVKVPSKRIDETIDAIVDHYTANRQDGEAFNDFVDRVGARVYEDVLRPISEVPELSKDTIDYYIDWNQTVLYKVERGEGECAI
ncbi:MAG: hypothetical protein IIC87_06235 [Chloroflexi bacterium]|nr:hypothetical protein [Chloroflexota bacterium]